MARPKNADPEQTKARLREAALASFAVNGRRGTSLRHVAEAAGVSLATINYYFGGKDALYRACLGAMAADLETAARPFVETMEELALTLGAARETPTDPRVLLGQIVRQGFVSACEHRDALRILMRPLLETGELDPHWREGILLPFMDDFVQRLAPLLGEPVDEVRMAMHSLLMLGARYALSSPAELARLVRISGEAEAQKAVVNHLVQVAELLLWKGAMP